MNRPLLLIASTLTLTGLSLNGCGDSGKGPSALSSLDGFKSISGEAAALSSSQTDAALVLLKHQKSYFNKHYYDGGQIRLRGDFSRNCSLGGWVELDATNVNVKQNRSDTRVSTIVTESSTKYSAMDCNLSRGSVVLNEQLVEDIRMMKGSVALTATSSATVKANGGTPSRTEEANSIEDFSAVTTALGQSGVMQIEGRDGSTLTSHSFEFVGFMVAMNVTDELRQELKDAGFDPLGGVDERKYEILKDEVKCKGSVKVDGQTFDCVPFIHRMLKTEFNIQ